MSDKFSIAKAFFDSDALMAGSASHQGAAFILLQLSELGLIQGYTSQKVIAECRKNLHLKLPDALPSFDQIVSHALTVLENPSDKDTVAYSGMAHKKDVLILAAAIKVQAHFLVTFNTKDFYPAPELGLTVLEPGDLLKRIRRKFSELVAD